MKIIVKQNEKQAAAFAACIFADLVKCRPDSAIGFATGHTPIMLYQELIADSKKRLISFDKATSFNLDEYYGLSKKDHQSYAFYMKENLFRHTPFRQNHLLNGTTKDPLMECKKYEDKIKKAGGIQLQILGIGHNGHIGFNEPGSSFSSRTRLVTLSADTRRYNSTGFSSLSQTPNRALTMGLGTIMEIKKIVLLAFGSDKSKIVKKALYGKIDKKIPASILQLHPDLMVILDEEAACKL